ncbi:MAG: BamA/TamA family outer membrane protein [Desulfobacterales bacterium]|nr:BamA/TamA family outer membrane protein [Desulfobacterales bacterium]
MLFLRFQRILLCSAIPLLVATGVLAAQAPLTSSPLFTVTNFRVEGNTLLPAGRVDELLAPFTGEKRDFDTVQQAVDRLRQAYHKRGFKTVAVILPEQELSGGTVRITVIEPAIRTITVVGNLFFDSDNIRRSLPALRKDEPPNLDAISASLQVANTNPAKKVSLTLRGGSAADELDATLKVIDDKPRQVSFSLDDTGTSDTGELRAGVLFSHANLFNRDHLLTLQYKTSPTAPAKVGIYAVGYRVPLYRAGAALDLYGAYADIDSGTVTAGTVNLDMAGKGTVLGARYNQNLARRGNYRHHLSYGLEHRAYENDISFAGTPLGNDITIHPLSLTYSGSWDDQATGAGFYLELVRNLPGWSRGGSVDFNNIRRNAPAGYTLVRFGGHMTRSFSADWQVNLRLNGQFTNDPLVPGELFGLGGRGSVRGFDERELADDRGYFASVEMQTPDMGPRLGISRGQLRGLVFYDSGLLDRVDPLPGETDRATIGSIGAGLRYGINKKLTAEVYYGYVVDGGGRSDVHDGRGHFSLRYFY